MRSGPAQDDKPPRGSGRYNLRVPTILLADDHAVVRAGLRNALDGVDGMAITAEVGDGNALRAALAAHTPDLLVMDVAMPDFEPLAAIRAMKRERPGMRILIVSAYADEIDPAGLLNAGADGYHMKDQPLADLVLAAQRVLKGERWISRPLVDQLLHRPSAPPAEDGQSTLRETPALTRRQRELLRLISYEYDNRAIAQTMDVSVKTVENHLTALYKALGVTSRHGATDYASRHPELLATHGLEAGDSRDARDGALTLLLVDDNPRYRQQLARMIGKACPGSRLYEAEDTAQALRLAAQVKPRLALVDVVLSDEDGILCARKIKTVSQSTRLVLMSAYPDREFRRLGMSAGAVAFIDKKDIDAATMRQIAEDARGSRISS
jgi:DNA-binding NarL/FixJ family response regulator